jgi:hypothetical protein
MDTGVARPGLVHLFSSPMIVRTAKSSAKLPITNQATNSEFAKRSMCSVSFVFEKSIAGASNFLFCYRRNTLVESI